MDSSYQVKWFVTYEFKTVLYYLSSSNDTASQLVWSQQQKKGLKFDSSHDAEKVLALVISRRKNKSLHQKFKVR